MKILLKEIMKSKSVTYRKLEKQSGISKTTLCEIANGHVSPTMDNMEKIAMGLEISISDLFLSEFK